MKKWSLFPIPMFLLALPGCSTSQWPETNLPKQLGLGEARSVQISSRDRWGQTGILVNPEHCLSVTASESDRWVDFFIISNADGYRYRVFEWYMGRLEECKQVPDENWFALGAAIKGSEETPQLIGTSWMGEFPAEGELLLFANDAEGWTWNNFGSVTVTVTRLR